MRQAPMDARKPIMFLPRKICSLFLGRGAAYLYTETAHHFCQNYVLRHNPRDTRGSYHAIAD